MGCTGHKLSENWTLYTRGGIRGIYIKKVGSYEEIPIPEDLLRMLLAEEIRAAKISQLETATTTELLGF